MKPEDTMSRLHAYLDGELDAAASVELEAQMAQNPALRARYERLRELSAAIREKADYHTAPAALKRERRFKSASIPAFALAAALSLVLALGLFLLRPSEDELMAREIVASHVRATLGGHLTDIASSDQHSVKPWLSGRLPFSPPVVDLASDGFALAGARLDYVDGQRAAVLVYKRRQHVIDVFILPGEARGAGRERDGFNVERFARDGMRYWLVSDLNRGELHELARLLSR
jgi:anti-sigma factor RsiW